MGYLDVHAKRPGFELDKYVQPGAVKKIRIINCYDRNRMYNNPNDYPKLHLFAKTYTKN